MLPPKSVYLEVDIPDEAGHSIPDEAGHLIPGKLNTPGSLVSKKYS